MPSTLGADTMNDPSQHGDVLPQYLAAILANLLSFGFGTTVGWPSPMQPILQAVFNASEASFWNSSVTGLSDFNASEASFWNSSVTGLSDFNASEASFWNSSVTGLSDEAFSWVGGMICIGGAIGTPIFGYLANAIGRKKSFMIAGILLGLKYLLIIIASDPEHIFAARIIAGFVGAGAACVVPIYVSEISEDRVRGVLGGFYNLFVGIGILAAYVVGSYTSYTFLALFGLGCAICFLILVICLPESPVYLIMNNQPDEAFNVLTKLRGNNVKLVEQEIRIISAQAKQASSSKISINEMFSDPPARKALIIVLVLCTFMQACGISPIIAFSVSIFQAAGSSLSPQISAIIIGALQIVGGFIGTIFMDKAGRKMLLMISGVGMTVTLAPIAYFLYLKNHNADADLLASIGWLPVTSLAVYIIVFGLGFGSVPFVLVSELFKNETKSAATSIGMTQLWVVAFIYIKFFSNISAALGIETCFAIFALCAAGGTIFTYFFVFETKGKSEVRIQEILRGQAKSCHQKSISSNNGPKIHQL